MNKYNVFDNKGNLFQTVEGDYITVGDQLLGKKDIDTCILVCKRGEPEAVIRNAGTNSQEIIYGGMGEVVAIFSIRNISGIVLASW